MNHKLKMIKANFSLFLFSTLCMAFISSCANQANIGGKPTSRWVMLGSRAIEFVGSGNSDVIPVSDKGDYQQLRFKIENRGTTIQEITVTYFDGTEQDVKGIDAVMAAGQYSKAIILPGGSKRISRVQYKYGAGTGGAGKGMMRLYAYKVVKP